MDAYIQEELHQIHEIVNNYDCTCTVLESETFKAPISELELKAAVTLDISGTVGEAISKMKLNKASAVIITIESRLAGIFTERDVLNRVIGIVPEYQDLKIRDYMTPNPLYLFKDDSIAHLMHNIHVGNYRHVPIVNNGDKIPVAVACTKDINHFILDHFPETILNTTSYPYRKVSKRVDA